ncbi:MAG TPA: 50S ribosomal protein L20 [Candidatus Hydrogenedentes bacterium]|jgi:large subunit ribosomal protein L20|nr:50S ribosomal protein L20 [Candidatus Hydrogenedentota bacterium]MDY0031753.1 50S ribosomal protein L20 [FCB group bacterium]NLT62496.1 50S ribosomal protein L20 [Candidatus Hydrogenedentota bacterium]HNZ19197.1 50S ribosomal protein L20 [Candidatus Hydrogenedentota bacterium]HOH32833.1 50S ribosomal protein L20 [Candidatus Hydrogenedentota bacterium]
MPRSTNSPASRQRRKKFIKLASGYRGSRHRLIKTARQAVEHAGVYAYRDRKVRKRDFRKLWIARINAATRANGMPYSRFILGLRKANIDVNRKMLAEMAVSDEAGFTKLVELAKAELD